MTQQGREEEACPLLPLERIRLAREFAKLEKMSIAELLLLQYLAELANSDSWKTWPGLAHLEENTRISNFWIRKILKKFQALGCVELLNPGTGSGPGRCHEYLVRFDRMAPQQCNSVALLEGEQCNSVALLEGEQCNSVAPSKLPDGATEAMNSATVAMNSATVAMNSATGMHSLGKNGEGTGNERGAAACSDFHDTDPCSKNNDTTPESPTPRNGKTAEQTMADIRERIESKQERHDKAKERRSSRPGKVHRVLQENENTGKKVSVRSDVAELYQTFSDAWKARWGKRPPAWGNRERKAAGELLGMYDPATVQKMLRSLVDDWESWHERFNWSTDERPSVCFLLVKQSEIFGIIEGGLPISKKGGSVKGPGAKDPRLTTDLFNKNPSKYLAIYNGKE